MTKSICENYFEDVSQQMVIRIDGRVIYLNHYPFLAYAGAFRGKDASWQLFGHVHTSPYCNDGLDIPRLNYLFPYQYDCGVDNNNFSPVSFEEISKHIKENENKIVEKTKKQSQ
jgi:calcineurin-like phosphoesterase family protein